VVGVGLLVDGEVVGGGHNEERKSEDEESGLHSVAEG